MVVGPGAMPAPDVLFFRYSAIDGFSEGSSYPRVRYRFSMEATRE
jgi:hypothetical protein